MSLSLAGAWILKTAGSDHIPGIEVIDSVPMSAKMKGVFKGERLSILQSAVGDVEEIQIMLRSRKGYSLAYYQLGKLNFENKNAFSMVVGCDKDFKYMSILRLGPAKAQRSLEQYTLDGSRREIRLEIDLDSPECGRVRMVKFLVRSADSADVRIPVGLSFHSAAVVNNWNDPGTHSAELVSGVAISIAGYTTRIINTKSGRSTVLQAESTYDTEAPETKRFNSRFTADEKVAYYVIKVRV